MVCDVAVVGTLASFMMNGVCCMWQMQEEDDRRDAIRKDIRVEYARQRLMDAEYWDYRPYHSDNSLQDEQSSQHDRRRQLLMTKRKHMADTGVANSCPPASMVPSPPQSPNENRPVRRRVRSDPAAAVTQSASAERRLRKFKAISASGDVSSLMDESDNDETDSEDELELFEIALS